ncbi:MAG: class I SAM-dependent DNA methyltransferase [Patescibacteria group bacterium]|nr:class I SAM-dependent DNA methyltransferase [Patescibacteria group bacterium]
MITGQLHSRINKLWEEFWTGGITNPLTVIEQISFLMFARLLDMRESTEQKKFDNMNRGKDRKFPGVFFTPKQQHMRWSQFKHRGGDEMLRIIRDELFPHFRTLGGNGSADVKNTFAEYMKDAQLMIQKPSLLVSAVNMIDELPLTQGDLYEYLLSKLTTAGINGQFRTPRHIIRLMVDLMLAGNEEEAITWTVGDPAAGTGGFLVSFLEALREHYTSEAGRVVTKVNSHEEITYTGDQITRQQWKHIQSGMFHGFDFDVTMLRIAAMNLMLHGVDTPDIHYQDTLSNTFPEKFPTMAADAFDLIMANPPFKGSLDYSDVHSSLTGKVKTKKTELLFLVLMLRMLKQGGRCAVVVPDGVLFGSSQAHKALRQMLIEQHQLEAVVKLPAGVFKPYAGVSTAILFFTKDGRTTDVWFYDVAADGLSLDDKRDPVEENDLPDIRRRWAKRNPKKDTDRTAKAFFVSKQEIAENAYDLSINRYKEIIHEEVKYDPPKTILKRLKMEAETAKDLDELGAMLG